MLNRVPTFRRPRRGVVNPPSRFAGDEFLRFTPEEARLIAWAEADHGYDPDRSLGVPQPLSPPPPVPPEVGDSGVRTIRRRRFVLYLGDVLLLEREYDVEDTALSREEQRHEFLSEALFGEQEAEEGEDDYEYDEEEEEDSGDEDECEEEW